MKKIVFLTIAILGNGFGSALMFQTGLGMSAWGAASSNVASYFNISLGSSFLFISEVFYIIALLIMRRFNLIEIGLSTLFLFSFSIILDVFVGILPTMTEFGLVDKIAVNVVGMVILLGSISLHLKVNLAVHPLDVFLKAMQTKVFKDVIRGTYFAYTCAFSIAVVFGSLSGNIESIGIGTVLILVFGGYVMGIYDTHVTSKL